MSTSTFGKYRPIAELGRGGMADVFLSVIEGPTGSGFAKLAVVKKLRAHLAEDAEFVSMLIDEARITARLNHPNVVQMLEVGHEAGEYFLAMEYLDGQPLHRIMRRAQRNGAALSRDVQMTIFADVLAGLHHAHELADYDGTPLNVVHRDATPQNIFVTYDGQVKVVDFGIAKAAGRISETRHGIVKGKVRYMSPEQALGIAIDRRSDIFAIGILLWQAATGQLFWGERDELAIVQALVSGEYQASPRAICPDVPEALDAICRRALARRAEDRYATAAEMRADLEAHIDVRMIGARRELSSLVCGMFVSERAMLRTVLEGIGTFTPSSAAFLAAVSMRAHSASMVTIGGGGSGSFAFGGVQVSSFPPPAPSGTIAVSSSVAPVAAEMAREESFRSAVLRRRFGWGFAGFAAAMVIVAASGVGGWARQGAAMNAVGGQGSTANAMTAVGAPAQRIAREIRSEGADSVATRTAPTALTPVQSIVPVPVHHPRWYPAPSAQLHPSPSAAADSSETAASSSVMAAGPRVHHGRLPLDTADPWSGDTRRPEL